MTRIETISFSAMEKLRRISLRSWKVGIAGFLAVVLMLWAMAIACHRTVQLIPGSTIKDGHKLVNLEMDNAHFEVSSQPALQPGVDYWLTPDDTVVAKWDTFELHWERVGKMCAFTTNTSTNDCQVCDYCNPPPELRGPPCFGFIQDTSFWKGVFAYEGFMDTTDPKVIVEYGSTGYRTGCPNNTPSSFQPETSGIYRIVKPGQSGVAAESKFHIVTSGMAEPAAYPLTHEIVDGKDYWVWTVGGSPLWEENFTLNLRVADIRILKGECGDGSAQGRKCDITIAREPVRPSRILFLPNFYSMAPPTVDNYTGGTDLYRCYSAAEPVDEIDGNFINLLSCRETYNTNQTLQKDATPSYLADSLGGPRPTERLTWVVEFNTAEGADTVMSTDKLVIEFTIRVKP